MSFSFQEELEKIEKAIVKGEYHESLEKLDKLLQIKEITVKEHVKAKILQTRILFFLGIFEWRNSYFEQGLIIIKDAVEKSQSINNNLLLFDSLYWKIYCSARKSAEKLEILLRLESLVEDIRKDYPSEYKRKQAFFLGVKAYESNWKISIGEEVAKDHKEKSIKLFVQSYEIFKEIDDKEHMLILMSAIIYSYGLEAKYDLLLEYLKKALKTAEQIDNKYFIAFFTYTLSTEFYWPRGELELFLEFLNKARRIYEELDNRRAIAQSDNVLGIYYIEKGEMERAAEYYKKALKFFEESGEPDMISALLNNLGLIFSTKGDYAKALEYLSKAYEISMKEKNLPRAFSQQLNVARIHSLKGELDKALELQKECLEYYEKIGDLPRISFSLLSLGLTYQSKGMNEKAMECFKRNLHFNEKIGNKLTLARSLSQLIVLLIEIGNRNEALKYFKQLKTINSELINTAINQFYRFSDAVILKSNSDIRDRIKAETLLEQLLEEELVIGMDLTSVIIYLTEVLIEEFKRTEDSKIKAKINQNIDRLREMAVSSNAHSLITEVLFLKAQIAFITLNLEKANHILSQARDLAEEKGLESQKIKIIKTQEIFKEGIIKLEEKKDKTVTISERMEILHFNGKLKDIKEINTLEKQINAAETIQKLLKIKI